MYLITNVIIVILEILGLRISIPRRKWGLFAFYTQLSNMVTLLSSLLLLLLGPGPFTAALRYLSTCMLTMTFMITLFVLVPMGGGFKTLMLNGNGLYHHTLCPVISVCSYILWEPHHTILMLPVILTLIYGITMLILNGLGRYDGPYPFFRVRHQSPAATVIWIIALTAVITLISAVAAYFTGGIQ